MLLLLLGLRGQSPTLLDIFFIVFGYATLVFLCLPVHEFAHAFAAHKLGDDTAKWYGRLTINPMKHLDVFGTVMLVLCGVGYAKPVPVNLNNFKNRKAGMAITSLAGPLSNLIMAIVSVAIFRIICLAYDSLPLIIGDTIYFENAVLKHSYMIFIEIFASINLGLAVFNLLPIPPLDGSKIFGAVLPSKWMYITEQYQQYITVVLMALLLAGALDVPLEYLRHGFGFVICGLFGMPNVF